MCNTVVCEAELLHDPLDFDRRKTREREGGRSGDAALDKTEAALFEFG